jgi:diguanylate cyclase
MRGRVAGAEWRRSDPASVRADMDKEAFSIMGAESGNQRRTLATAAIALGKIVELELPADPQSYELWYAYAAGYNQKLRDEIDHVLQQQGRLSESDLGRIYAQYISSTRSTGDFERVARRLADEVGQVTRMISAAVTTVERYDERLSEGTAAANSATSEADLKRVVEDLLSATKSMARENDSLKEELEASRVRSEKLTHEIEAVRIESLTDALTQVGNRLYFDDTLARAIVRAGENDVPLTLLLVDIDHFKKVNDQFGHQMGDDVLRLVAARLKSSVRDGEIARYGGEEFAVILYNKSIQIGKLIAERIRASIESAEMRVRSTGASIGRVTVSIGVAELKPRLMAADIVQSADDALYAAKRKGRNCVVLEGSIEAAAPEICPVSA